MADLEPKLTTACFADCCPFLERSQINALLQDHTARTRQRRRVHHDIARQHHADPPLGPSLVKREQLLAGILARLHREVFLHRSLAQAVG